MLFSRKSQCNALPQRFINHQHLKAGVTRHFQQRFSLRTALQGGSFTLGTTHRIASVGCWTTAWNGWNSSVPSVPCQWPAFIAVSFEGRWCKGGGAAIGFYFGDFYFILEVYIFFPSAFFFIRLQFNPSLIYKICWGLLVIRSGGWYVGVGGPTNGGGLVIKRFRAGPGGRAWLAADRNTSLAQPHRGL